MAMYKCPDCSTWWQGPEHRCPVNTTGTSTAPMEVPWRWTPYVVPPLTTGSVCNCHLKGQIATTCPVHDVTKISYTGNA